MTVEERLWQLVLRLRQKTVEGTVFWEETPSKAAFQTSVPKFTVRVSEVPTQYADEDPERAIDYDISIYDERGRLLERADDVGIAGAIDETKSYSTMKELYTLARRSALGVESALDELLASLDEASA